MKGASSLCRGTITACYTKGTMKMCELQRVPVTVRGKGGYCVEELGGTVTVYCTKGGTNTGGGHIGLWRDYYWGSITVWYVQLLVK